MTAEIKDFNPQRPCNVDWFQRELNLACSDKGIQFRIVWAPELNSFRYAVNGVEFIGKKYKHPLGQGIKETKGHRIVKNGVQVGYEYPNGIIVGSPDGIRLTEIVKTERALSLFVVEQRLRDDVARKQHYENRFLNVDGKQIDLLGEFPKEGIWTWFHQIEAHDSAGHVDTGFCRVCPCCRHFDDLGMMCIGGYREPDRRDLNFVLASIQESMKTPLLRNPADPPTAREIQREVTKRLYLAEKAQQKREREEDLEVAEEIASLLRITKAPTFDLGQRPHLVEANK